MKHHGTHTTGRCPSGPRQDLHAVNARRPSGLLLACHSVSSGLSTREWVWKQSLSRAGMRLGPIAFVLALSIRTYMETGCRERTCLSASEAQQLSLWGA